MTSSTVCEFPTAERRGQRLHEEMLADARQVVESMSWAELEESTLRVVS